MENFNQNKKISLNKENNDKEKINIKEKFKIFIYKTKEKVSKINFKKINLKKINLEKEKLFLKHIKLNYIILVIFIIFAVIFLVNGIINICQMVSFNDTYKDYSTVQGVLNGINYSSNEQGEEVTYLVYEYEVNGKTYEAKQELKKNQSYKQNQKATIYYKVLYPQEASVPYKHHFMGYIISYFVLFAVDLILCFLYYRVRLRKKPNPQDELNELDQKFEQVLDKINNTNDKLFKKNKKGVNQEKFEMKTSNIYELKIKDIDGNVVGDISKTSDHPSMAEPTPIDTSFINKQIQDQLEKRQEMLNNVNNINNN